MDDRKLEDLLGVNFYKFFKGKTKSKDQGRRRQNTYYDVSGKLKYNPSEIVKAALSLSSNDNE